MPADGEVAGTFDYASGWLVLAVGLLVAVVLWNGGLLWWGRPRRVRADDPEAAPAGDLDSRRRETLAAIDEIEAAHGRGELPARQAHQRLSAVVRAFVADAAGVPAPTMTLEDLRRADVPALVSVIEIVYPPEFGPGDRPADELDRALRRAREVVGAPWS